MKMQKILSALALAILASLGTGLAQAEEAVQEATKESTKETIKDQADSKPESKSELKAQALNLFEQFKKLDSNSDPALVDLYSNDAVIYSGVERERGGVLFEKFKKADFKAEVERAIKNPHTVELNKQTVYTEAKIKETRHEAQENVIELSFTARRGESGAKVHWLLRPATSAETNKEHTLVIFDEHSTVYALKPRPLKHPHSQI